MKSGLLFIALLTLIPGFSQSIKDTTFIERGFTCTCRYNQNSDDDKGIFDLSGEPARYPGGEEEWKKFVRKNINKHFKGNHTVELRFGVDKNGDLSEFQLLNRVPNQKYEEVVRLLKSSGKWFPAVQKGFCVKSTVKLSFQL